MLGRSLQLQGRAEDASRCYRQVEEMLASRKADADPRAAAWLESARRWQGELGPPR